MQLDADALLVDLDPAQRAAVCSPATPLAIVAPAGSGKTRVLTRRIAWRVATGDADPRHVLALTFTRKAASELVTRLRALGLHGDLATGTFHAVAFAQLRARWAEQGRAAPTLLPSKASFLSKLPEVRRARITPGDVATEIDWAKARFIAADRYAEAVAAAGRRTPASAPTIANLYVAYEAAKREKRLVDFDDLLRLCIDALERDPDFAEVQRWRFRHLFVDEFQDVNPLQFRLLEAWRGTRYDLCVVGDPQQAIYGWNGADSEYLDRFREHYPPAEVIVLEHNYRSTPQILAAAASVFDDARILGRPVVATTGDGAAPVIERHATDADEAVAIARAVRDRHAPGAAWSAQAVLVRTHAQTQLIVDALRTAGIPAQVRGSTAVLDRADVRKALDRMRASSLPLSAVLPDLAPGDEADAADDPEHREAFDALLDLAHDHLRLQPDASAAGFAAWVGATLRAETARHRVDAVDVATFHAAKGLEWSIVHLAGLEDGFVPITYARSRAAKAEEARLLYVAMTRARRELRCTWAAQRAFGTKLMTREPSPLVRSLLAAQRSPSPASPAAADPEWRSHLAAQRAALAEPNDRTPVPVAALREWRERAARTARIDPLSLLNDRALEAVATARPRDVDELAAVAGIGSLMAARFGAEMLAALDGADV